MKDKKIIKVLNGHSGCKVNLIVDNNTLYVSKSSATKKYNFRLKKQCQKQRSFISTDRVFAPKILDFGYEEELFYFDMEYIKAKTLAEYVNDISVNEISDFIRCLFDSLYLRNGKIADNTSLVFLKKISDLKQSLCCFGNLKDSFQVLESYNWSNIPKTPCHGDLTLENILITSDKNLYLIDFLDSFYNSWMIDIAKLLQDLELKWSFRYEVINPNMDVRLLVAKETLIKEILKLEDGEEKLNAIYHILLLNVIRIFPYAKDNITLDFLNDSIKLILNNMNRKIGGAV